jgi:hypothetical protein
MNRQEAITTLIEQVQNHNFHHLYRNRRSGHQAQGWSGGLSMYSLNNENVPNPAAHFQWLQAVLNNLAQQGDQVEQRVQVANQIMAWGGMPLVVENEGPTLELLNNVIQKARDWTLHLEAPMNSSWTKVAAVFGYYQGNTIWDSRVSTAVCFRLACIFKAAGDTPQHARGEFPDLGFIPGQSQRVKQRMPLVRDYWPDAYQKWDGHIAGANFMREIADQLNLLEVPCPPYGPEDDENHVSNGSWTAWKVNMVFFADDIVGCQQPEQRCVGGEICSHRLVNDSHGIHFEPTSISGLLNDAEALHLPRGEHGLNEYRLLLEFFRMGNGNCKISARIRTADPCFEQVWDLARETDCPPKMGGMSAAANTSSVFVFPLGPIGHGKEMEAIRSFVCQPDPAYQEFLQRLPDALTVGA